MDRTQLLALQQQREAMRQAEYADAQENNFILKLHDTDVIFSKDSLEEFIRLIQRQGINNLTIYSVGDLLAGNKYQTVTVRFPPPNWPDDQPIPQEFDIRELKDRKNYFVFVRYSFCWEDGGTVLSDGSFVSANEKNGRHVFVKTVNDITFYKTYLTDQNGQLILDNEGNAQLDTTKSSIFSEAFSDEIPLPSVFPDNVEANEKNGTFTVTVDNVQYVIKIRGFNDDGDYIGKVKVDPNTDENGTDGNPLIDNTDGYFLRGDGQWANSIDNDLLPVQDDTSSLGSPTYAWKNIYISESVLPNENEGADLGATDNIWNNLYVNNINASGDLIVNNRKLQISHIPSTSSTSAYFWRGDASWSNELTGMLSLPTEVSGRKHTNSTQPTKNNALFYANGNGYFTGNLGANKVFNAVFNDYAECRTTIILKAGHVVQDNDDGTLSCTQKRLIPGAQVISDTFGHSMGYDEKHQTHLAVAGRVLVYTYQPRENYHAGMAVCSAPDGTVDIMTREEIKEYPDCIIGIVSEIPDYERWGTEQVKVDGRIWIKVK